MQQTLEQSHGRDLLQRCRALSQTLLNRPQNFISKSNSLGSFPPAQELSAMAPIIENTKAVRLASKDELEVGSRSRSRPRRKSYDSIREVESEVPQSFSDLPKVVNTSNGGELTARRPSSLFYDVPTFGQNRFAGRKQSKSSIDLRRPVFRAQPYGVHPTPEAVERTRSALDNMPLEVIELILSYLIDTPRPQYAPRNAELRSCLRTSKAMYMATLSSLYKNVTLPHSMTFSKIMKQIGLDPGLGALVRRLDFSHYTSIGFGRTRQASSELQNVTPKTLKLCLDLMPGLIEFLVHEHVDDELDEAVLQKLFIGSKMQALDFCACSSRTFTQNFSTSLFDNADSFPFLRRLSLHECSTLQAPVFEALLPRLPSLTHLDVSHTLIEDDALCSIPKSARLTHLNLGRCTQLTGERVVEFLKTHDAVKDTLVVLNLMADVSRYTLLDQEDVEDLIPVLPLTLRSLNLGGAKIKSSTIPLLLPLTKVLEELGLAFANITVADVNSFFRPVVSVAEYDDADEEDSWHPWTPSTLRYLDLTGVAAVSQASLIDPSCVISSPQSYPLEVVELGDNVIKHLRERTKSNRSIGWVVRELGRRGWFVREPGSGNVDDGSRSWKMGARWWGMRKLPVAVQEVGGMYGHYMFKS